MAMEKHFVVRETHTRGITALGYNPIKREILIGFEGKNSSFLTAAVNQLAIYCVQ
jgi:hypothetical protein